MQVDDWDRFSKNDSIGEVAGVIPRPNSVDSLQVQIPLNTVDFSKTTREWRVLQPVMHRVSLTHLSDNKDNFLVFSAVAKEVSAIRGTTSEFLGRGFQVQERSDDRTSGTQVQDPL